MTDTYTQLTELKAAGLRYRVIAKILGVTEPAIASVIHRRRKAAGETRLRRKLTDRQIAEILVRARNGDPVKLIAERVGVSMGAVGGRMMQFRREGKLEYRYDKGMSDA